jgi:hypothetical protein
MNLMLIDVSARASDRAVRLPAATWGPPRADLSKSVVSRRFVALSVERKKAWMSADR